MKTSTKLLSVPFALALGLGGASAYAYSIANAHIMPYRGGNGGNHYAVSCPQGSVAVGAYGRSGAYVDRLGLICRRVMPNGNLGATLRTAAAGAREARVKLGCRRTICNAHTIRNNAARSSRGGMEPRAAVALLDVSTLPVSLPRNHS